MTKTELRILYILRKNGPNAVSAANLAELMSAQTYPHKTESLDNLQQLGLITAGKFRSSPNHPKLATYYGFTEIGDKVTRELIESGQMKNPDKERRGAPVKRPHA